MKLWLQAIGLALLVLAGFTAFICTVVWVVLHHPAWLGYTAISLLFWGLVDEAHDQLKRQPK